MSSHVTISDVAATAGVSKATVSRYISGKEHLLAQATRVRIKRAIEITGYRPSATARALSTGRATFVGIAVADIAVPGVAEAVAETLAALQAAGHEALIAQVGGKDACGADSDAAVASPGQSTACNLLLSQGAAGLVLIGDVTLTDQPVDLPVVRVEDDPSRAVSQLLERLRTNRD